MEIEGELSNGLIVGHAYSVTDIKTVCKCIKYILSKLVCISRLRNTQNGNYGKRITTIMFDLLIELMSANILFVLTKLPQLLLVGYHKKSYLVIVWNSLE